MRIERTKNATRNIIFGGIHRVYSIFAPFCARTLLIYLMGVEYLGLNSLFISILSVLNLAELGVGNAMVFSMYKAIAEDDSVTICALMKLYRLYYRVIGLVIMVAGLCLTPFIPVLIKGTVPADINIYVLYLMNLVATVLTYWLFAYKNCLFGAFQRNDITSKINLGISVAQTLFQIAVLLFARNYYLYVTVLIGMQIASNLVTAATANKFYPDYHPKGSLPKEQVRAINQKVRDLFTSKIGSIIVNSADTNLNSDFLGLVVLAKYQNYFFIFTSITGFVEIVFSACMAGVGNSLLLDTKDKVFTDFKTFALIISWISGFCAACFLCLYQPFIELWVGRELLLDFSIVICLVIYFFVYEINRLLNAYKDAAGMWHEDRFRPLVTALSNLSLNLIMVQFIGLYGIILSTVITMCVIGMPWLIHNLFSVIFEKRRQREFLLRMSYYIPVTILACVVTYFLCQMFHLPLAATVGVRLIICIVIPNLIFLILYCKLPEFQRSLVLVDSMTRGKIAILHKMANKQNTTERDI